MTTENQQDDLEQIDDLVQQGKEHIDNTVEGTLISILIDQSGSMRGTQEATIEGFNTLIEEQKQEPGKAWVTLTLFDTTAKVIYTAVPIGDVQPLDAKTYKPSGGTALLDAQGLTITRTEEWLEGLDPDERPGKVLFVTMTDGGENSSTDYTWESVKKLIDKKQEADEWRFAYTGANQDSFQVAARMGVAKGYTSNYLQSAAGSKRAFAGTSSSISNLRAAQSVGEVQDFFVDGPLDEKVDEGEDGS